MWSNVVMSWVALKYVKLFYIGPRIVMPHMGSDQKLENDSEHWQLQTAKSWQKESRSEGTVSECAPIFLRK